MELEQGILQGQTAAGARLMRWLEDGDPRAPPILQRLLGRVGKAHLIGITGPPGGGKSTLTSALISELRRHGRRVGVIAVDPSSPFSGGAILGDRVRMQRHAVDPDVFIRSMGSRGQLGGLAKAVFDAALVMDAMGFDLVLIETVGVGQGELDIAALAHTTVVLALPGTGDEIQAIKAGILEVGDIVVLNKADLPGAAQAERQLSFMLHLRRQEVDGWCAPLLKAVASAEQGIVELAQQIEAHRHHLVEKQLFSRQFAQRSRQRLHQILAAKAADRLLEQAAGTAAGAQLLAQVEQLQIDPASAAELLLAGCRYQPEGASDD